MTALDVNSALATARRLATWAAEVTRFESRGTVTTKAHPADLVTELDTRIERHVRDVIAAEHPDHLVVGEEFGGETRNGTPTWYLDPVDGTTNLANGIPWTSFSLALALDRIPQLGVVADPWRDELYHAVSGHGAQCNGRAITASDTTELSGRVVGTELASFAPWPGMRGLSDALARQFCTVRIMGSGTLTLTHVAAGRSAGAVIGQFGAEDHLAAALIAQESGAVVLAETGQPELFPEKGGILVAAPGVADRLFTAWRHALDDARVRDASTGNP